MKLPLSCFVFHSRWEFQSFENCTVKLLIKETKWTSLEVRTHPTFLETLISKYDFGPVELPGLSRNSPQVINRVGITADFGQGFGKRAAHPRPIFPVVPLPGTRHVSQVNVMYNKIT